MGYNGQSVALTFCQVETMHNHVLKRGLSYGSYCDNPKSDLVISSGQTIVWENPKLLNRNVVVQSGASLTIKCNVLMGKDKTIVVHPNGKLIIDGGAISNLCDKEFWKGIEVIGNSTASQWPTGGVLAQGSVEMKNGAKVQNAEIGVTLYKRSQPTNTTGGILITNSASFVNCKQAVAFGAYNAINPINGQVGNNRSRFSKTAFELDDDFFGLPTDFNFHVVMRKVKGIYFRGCSFSNNNNQATSAIEKGVGIAAYDADFLVGDLCTGGAYPCSNSLPTVFDNLMTGIQAGNISTLHTFRVTKSVFNNNAIGISANKVDNALIAENTFNVGHKLANTFNPIYTGIQMVKSTNYKIEENNFNRGNGDDTHAYLGTVAQHSGSEYNEVYKNSYDQLNYGNLANGTNRNFNDDEVGLVYLCNNNSKNDYDFGLPYGGSVAAKQGDTDKDAGNCFSLPSNSETHFQNYGAALSYYWKNCEITDFTMGTVNPIAIGVNANCPSKSGSGEEPGFLTPADETANEALVLINNDPKVKQTAAGLLIRDDLVKEEANLADVRRVLQAKGTQEGQMAVIDAYLQEGDLQSASQLLSSFNSPQNEASFDFFELKQLQIQSLSANQEEVSIVKTNQVKVVAIAERTNPSYASQQAQNLVNLVYPNTYRVPIELPIGIGERGTISDSSVKGLKNVNIVPNPVRDIATINYDLPKNDTYFLIIFDINGKILFNQKLPSEDGNIELNTGSWPSGLYYYVISSHLRAKLHSEKFSIVR